MNEIICYHLHKSCSTKHNNIMHFISLIMSDTVMTDFKNTTAGKYKSSQMIHPYSTPCFYSHILENMNNFVI